MIANENAWALARPPATPSLSVFLPKSRQRIQDGTPWCHVVPWCHMTSGVMTKWLCAIYIGHTIRKSRKIRFLKMATLTYDLDLRTHPRYCHCQPPSKFWVRMSNGSVGRALTDKHTHRTDFIPSTADVGGKKINRKIIGQEWFTLWVMCLTKRPF